MSERRRAIVVGCGNIAGGYNRGPGDALVLTHALAYIRHPQHELVACVDPDGAARAAFMSKWGIAQGYASLDEALRASHFDVASVCTPTGTHLPVLNRLLESDVTAIFAEKPLDGDAAGARRIGAAFREKGVPVAVNLTRRFDPAMAELRAQIAAGTFGSLCTVVGWYDGGVVNNGVHLLDLAAYLTGRKAMLGGVALPQAASGQADPPVSAMLDFDGVPFHVAARPAQAGSRFELDIALSEAIVTIEDSGFSIRVRKLAASDVFDGSIVPERGEWIPTRYGDAMLAALDELVAWSPGAVLSSDIESASHSIELAGEMRRRAQENLA